MKKDIIKIVVLLIILGGIIFGVSYGLKSDYVSKLSNKYNTKEKNQKKDNNNNTKNKKEEITPENNNSEETSKENLETPNEKPKEIIKQDNNTKEETSKEQVVEQTPTVQKTKYYKEIKCTYLTTIEGDQVEYYYIGKFPAYKEENFSPATNLEVSELQIYYNLTDYTSIPKEEREEFNKELESIKVEYPGYSGGYTLQGNVAVFTFTGNASSFTRNFTDFSGTVTYDSYLNYFRNKGINCNQS